MIVIVLPHRRQGASPTTHDDDIGCKWGENARIVRLQGTQAWPTPAEEPRDVTGSASSRRVWTGARETPRLARQRMAPGVEIGRIFHGPGKRGGDGVVIRHCRFHQVGFAALLRMQDGKACTHRPSDRGFKLSLRQLSTTWGGCDRSCPRSRGKAGKVVRTKRPTGSYLERKVLLSRPKEQLQVLYSAYMRSCWFWAG